MDPAMSDFTLAKGYFTEGIKHFEKNNHEEAERSFSLSLAIMPDRVSTLSNLSAVLIKQKKYTEASHILDRIIAMGQADKFAWLNLGIVKAKDQNHEGAVECFDRVLGIDPYNFDAFQNRGTAQEKLGRHDLAILDYERALTLNPHAILPRGKLQHLRMRRCDWKDYDDNLGQLLNRLGRQQDYPNPFPILALTDSPALQLTAAEGWTKVENPTNTSLGPIPKPGRTARIRIGYFSADYHNHATTYLMAGLFENHDRDRFEIIGFSFGPDQQDEMRGRVSAAFDQFFEVGRQSPKAIATLARDMGIDIAVDLKGYTQDCRADIFSFRAAPIQVNYLGYPGTMGAEYIDYIIADKTLIPPESQPQYTEKVVYLPHSYQVNDSKRQISDRHFSREELSLPSNGFVFCCFNNNYKITPGTFAIWMRILKQVDGAVLWLFEDNPSAAANLKLEAMRTGVDPERVIFAKRLPLPEHLARIRLADLFLDTLPYNAHTTASDALWAGLPVLTLMGQSFASRVAGSLLNAMGLPELITTEQEEYERLAVDLATHPEKLARVRGKLAENRLTAPLFDTSLFTRHIEAAYLAMYERYQDDLPPAPIVINS
jgi:predicted O-linked N-acetylglucosamine transferase (SPINDLY family)